ncbi:hypothetical protein G3O06_07765 [Burkholderia sp. Ac-20345]|uniref:hypothetical protein n=1 Tax=Burkholderia sp. Ac-20345 TaxID=2703891 RepID=UPI00197B7D11|nr:hypothetical protein [Burkholderia sp. Ac-20345]MBN3777447.1 hypothetical protein [Burkholderia sp. Ac-20345]
MTTKVFAQRDLSFAHLQSVLELLPDAVAEAGGGKSNPMLVAQGISAVASGTDHRFFAALTVDGVVGGFMAAVIETDIFLGVRTAREVFAWLRPSARNAENQAALLEAFEAWATAQKAERLECLAELGDAGERFAAAASSRGYARASTVLRKVL